jgi:adenylate cyclase class 2
MMMEVEIKTPCADPDGLRQRIQEKGGVFQGRYHQSDVYYSHPCRDFALTDEALRIRSQPGLVQMHYKGPKIDSSTKTREELGTFLPDQEAMASILERLGFRPVMTVHKERELHLMGDIEICLDNVEGLRTYVELENSGEDLDAARQQLLDLMAELGLQGSERRSYLELLLEGGHA